MARIKLDNPKTRQRILAVTRRTGSITQGIKASGVSEATVRRYRDTHPEFEEQILDAQQFFKIKRSIKFGWKIMEDAKKFLHDEIRAGTCPHAIAYKIAYENDVDILG